MDSGINDLPLVKHQSINQSFIFDPTKTVGLKYDKTQKSIMK